MNRMKIRVVGVAAIVIAIFGAAIAQQPKKPPVGGEHKEHDEMMQACAKACSDCQRACGTCTTHCTHLLESGKKEHMKTLMTCQDCADICAAAAQIVSRGGPFSATVCEACADACDQCAKQCEHAPDDEEMKRCAQECRKCQKACEQMAKHSGHSK